MDSINARLKNRIVIAAPFACVITLFFAVLFLPYSAHAAVRTRPLPGTVVLTIDDGPNPIYTPQVLRILRKYHVHATWFVMGGFAKRHPELVKAIIADGNTVGNHTVTHPKLTRVSERRIRYELATANAILKKITGHTPVCLRPPFGLSNSTVERIAHEHGLHVIQWDLNSFDYNRPGVKRLTQWVVRRARPGDIILMHDGPKARAQTVRALPGIIVGLRKRGIGLSTIC